LWSSPGATAFTLLESPLQGGYALFVSVEFAGQAPNPVEAEAGWGRLHSELLSDPDLLAALLRDPDSRTATFAPDHSVQVGLPYPNFPTGPSANDYYVWSPDSAAMAAALRLRLQGEARATWMTARATDASGRFSDWLSGRVYNYDATAFHARRDETGQVIDHLEAYLDSDAEAVYHLQGTHLYGWGLVRDEMQDAAETLADAISHPELAL